jgi:hypothetical protein
MKEPILERHELESSTWKKIKAYLEIELADRRNYNDGKSLDAVATAFIRGDIDRIKKLLNIESKAPD